MTVVPQCVAPMPLRLSPADLRTRAESSHRLLWPTRHLVSGRASVTQGSSGELQSAIHFFGSPGRFRTARAFGDHRPVTRTSPRGQVPETLHSAFGLVINLGGIAEVESEEAELFGDAPVPPTHSCDTAVLVGRNL
jgi:hypothetical protein